MTDRRPREIGASGRVSGEFVGSERWPWFLAGFVFLATVVGGGLLTMWVWSFPVQSHHPGLYINDLIETISNAGGDLGHAGLAHLYAGNGSIVVALPGFQLALVGVLRFLVWFGLPVPGVGGKVVGDDFVFYVSGAVWTAMVMAAYAVGMAAIFPMVALARRCGLRGPVLGAAILAGAGALWWQTELWGHPEDAVVSGLVAWALVCCVERRWSRMGWLLGLALAVQPLVLLAVPLFLAVAGVRRWLPLILRMAVPGLVAVAVPLIGDPGDTLRQLTKQPVILNIALARQTPWVAAVPHVNRFTIEAGWPRTVALGLAVAVAVGAWRVFTRIGRVDPVLLTWLVGLSLGLRWVFEPLFIPYYLAPALVFFMLAAAASGGPRLAAVIVAAGGLCYIAGWPNLGEWGYEGLLVAGLVVVGALSVPGPTASALGVVPIPVGPTDDPSPGPTRRAVSVDTTRGLPA